MTLTRRVVSAATGALLLAAIAAGAIVAAEPAPPGVVDVASLPPLPDRDQTVQGWLVEERAGEQGHLIRITRTSGPYRLEYRHLTSGGGDRIVRQRVSAAGGGCAFEEELDPDLIYHIREIRSLLKAALAQCAASPLAVRTALSGLDPAYLRAVEWHRAAVVATFARNPPPPIYGPDEAALAACDNSVADTAEREIAEMNAFEAAQSVAC